MRALCALLATIPLLTLLTVESARAAAPLPVCQLDAKSGLFGGGYGVIVNGQCTPLGQDGAQSTAPVEYRTIGCTADGHEVIKGAVQLARCPSAVPRCTLLADGGMSGTPFWAYLVQYRVAGGPWISGDYWCPQTQGQAAAPDAATIRDRVVRLLPSVAIGTTDDHVSLVNIQTLFWADTADRRSLGTVQVTGHRVWLRIEFDSASWDFGDGARDTAAVPGRVYDDVGAPCRTKLCPDYYGHVYRTVGEMTVRLRVSWRASWSLDGSHFTAVGPGPITGPEASYRLTIEQARGVLVADDR